MQGERLSLRAVRASRCNKVQWWAQFELCISQGVIPKSPRFYQRAEGSPVAHSVVAEILRSA